MTFTCDKLCKSCKIGCVPEWYFPLNKQTLYVKHVFASSFFHNAARELPRCSHWMPMWVTWRNPEVSHFRPKNKTFVGGVELFNRDWRYSGLLEWLHKLYRITRRLNPGFGTMLNAAAAERNKEPILSVLRESVNSGRPLQALEISSGTGQHVTHFAQALRNIIWQPSEYDRQSLAR